MYVLNLYKLNVNVICILYTKQERTQNIRNHRRYISLSSQNSEFWTQQEMKQYEEEMLNQVKYLIKQLE